MRLTQKEASLITRNLCDKFLAAYKVSQQFGFNLLECEEDEVKLKQFEETKEGKEFMECLGMVALHMMLPDKEINEVMAKIRARKKQ